MTSNSQDPSSLPTHSEENPSVRKVTNKTDSERSVYDKTFWWSYVANILLVAANALTFRFADMVNLLGGTAQLAGTIVSVGSIGALFGRFFLGQWIDRYGVRPLWIISSILYMLGIGMMLTSPDLGFVIYIGRTFYAFGLGGMFACSMTHIQNHVPPHRRTEIIGTLGSSGFLGMITGSQLSDLIISFTSDSFQRHEILFGTSIAMAVLYLVIVASITRRDKYQKPAVSPPALPLLRRYWPGWVVMIAMIIGMAFTCSSVFIARYATEMGLRGVGTYFTAYAVTAFTVRILTRHTSKIYGRHRLILFGLIGHTIGYAMLCNVTQEWHFLLPAMCSGFAHALLFPCVVSLGTAPFPQRYRGTGTTLILCFVDIGGVLTAPILGAIIDNFGFQPMFLSTAGVILFVTILYGVVSHRVVDPEMLGKFSEEDPDIQVERNTSPPAISPPAQPEPCRSGCA